MHTCPHQLERRLEHHPTGEPDLMTGIRDYLPGDVMVLVCPHGCPEIEITIGRNKEETA